MITSCSLTTAVATLWDTVIVGAGPAGASSALRLAQAGRRVLLVDRDTMPRGKVCGCCLSRAALSELHALAAIEPSGLSHVIATGIPLAGVRLAAWGCTARIPLASSRVLSREALDTALVTAAVRAGAAWLPEATVVAVTDEPGRASSLTLRTSADVRHIVHGHSVILAAGLADLVRVHGLASGDELRRTTAGGSRIGVGAVVPAEHAAAWLPMVAGLPTAELVMAVGRGGYCGIVRLEDGRIDLAAAVDRGTVSQAGSPAAAVETILRDAFGGSPRLPADGVWRATPPLSHTSQLVLGTGRRIFRVGDAAGYVEPFTGEGIGWALSSGRLVAESLLTASSPDEAALRYEHAYAAHFRPRHTRCRRVARSLRIPVVVAAAVRAAGIIPWAARLLAPAVIGHAPDHEPRVARKIGALR